MPNPNAESTTTTLPTYNRNGDMQLTDHYAQREHNLAMDPGPDRPASELYWSSQQLQQVQQMQQMQQSADEMRLRGQHSIGMSEWTGFQRAEYGEFPIPTQNIQDWNFNPTYPSVMPFQDDPVDQGYTIQ
jgi:hypothetical protein